MGYVPSLVLWLVCTAVHHGAKELTLEDQEITALRLSAGEVGDPVRSSVGYHVIQVVDREPGSTPPLAEIEEMVRAEWIRRAGDRALREYLEELHERADVRVVQELP